VVDPLRVPENTMDEYVHFQFTPFVLDLILKHVFLIFGFGGIPIFAMSSLSSLDVVKSP